MNMSIESQALLRAVILNNRPGKPIQGNGCNQYLLQDLVDEFAKDTPVKQNVKDILNPANGHTYDTLVNDNWSDRTNPPDGFQPWDTDPNKGYIHTLLVQFSQLNYGTETGAPPPPNPDDDSDGDFETSAKT